MTERGPSRSDGSRERTERKSKRRKQEKGGSQRTEEESKTAGKTEKGAYTYMIPITNPPVERPPRR